MNGRFLVFNSWNVTDTQLPFNVDGDGSFNNILVTSISYQSVLLMKETRVSTECLSYIIKMKDSNCLFLHHDKSWTMRQKYSQIQCLYNVHCRKVKKIICASFRNRQKNKLFWPVLQWVKIKFYFTHRPQCTNEYCVDTPMSKV